MYLLNPSFWKQWTPSLSILARCSLYRSGEDTDSSGVYQGKYSLYRPGENTDSPGVSKGKYSLYRYEEITDSPGV